MYLVRRSFWTCIPRLFHLLAVGRLLYRTRTLRHLLSMALLWALPRQTTSGSRRPPRGGPVDGRRTGKSSRYLYVVLLSFPPPSNAHL